MTERTAQAMLSDQHAWDCALTRGLDAPCDCSSPCPYCGKPFPEGAWVGHLDSCDTGKGPT